MDDAGAGLTSGETEADVSDLYLGAEGGVPRTLWKNGIVKVCWDPAWSISRPNFLEEAATVKRRLNEEWPTAAKVSFVGWRPCVAGVYGMAAIKLSDTTVCNGAVGCADTGYLGTSRNGVVEMTVTYGGFSTSTIPHEFGHTLGFKDEPANPEMDPTVRSTVCLGWPGGFDGPGGRTLGGVDTGSIMAANYCNWTVGHLSKTDRTGVRLAYGWKPYRYVWSGTWRTVATNLDFQLGDFNGDGRQDLVYRSGQDIYVALSNGSGFGAPVKKATWSTGFDWKLADVNWDGYVDLIGRRGTEIQVSLNTGASGTFAGSSQWATWATAYDYTLADVNGDGRADLIGRYINGSDIQVALALPTGGFAGSSSWATWNTAFDHRLADVNGDGRADLVGRSGTRITVALSTGTYFAAPTQDWASWNTAYDYQLFDVDGDARADLIGRNGTDLQIATSTGSSFANVSRWATWSTGTTHRFGDLDGDGRADLIGQAGTALNVALSSN